MKELENMLKAVNKFNDNVAKNIEKSEMLDEIGWLFRQLDKRKLIGKYSQWTMRQPPYFYANDQVKKVRCVLERINQFYELNNGGYKNV